MKEFIVNTFNAGKIDDVRELSKTGFYNSQHFDIFTQPKRLVPYLSQTLETSDTIGSYRVKDFLTSSNGRLYVKGENQPTNNKTKLMYKADPTSLAAGSYTFPTNATGNAVNYPGCFIEYKNYLWGFQGTNQIFKYGDITGSPTITDSVATTSATISSVAQGIIGKDDNLYLFFNNIIVKITPAGVVSEVTTIVPTNYKITSVDYYGTYLAIGVAPVSTVKVGLSKLIIWDYVAADPTEIADFGEGSLMVVGNIEGRIIGISDRFLTSAYGNTKGTMVMRSWAGGQPQVFKEIQSFNVGKIYSPKVIKNNKLYWLAQIIDKENETWQGIWVFGRKDINGNFTVTLDTVQDGTSGTFFGFAATGNYWHIAYDTDASAYAISTTGVSYATTSVWESCRIQADGLAKLRVVSMNYNALPSAGQIVLKYRKEGQTLWTTLFVDSTDNSTGKEIDMLQDFNDTVSISIANPCVVTLVDHKLTPGQKIRFTTTGALPTGLLPGTDYYVLTAGFTVDAFRVSTSIGGTAITTTGTQSGVQSLDRSQSLPTFQEIQFRIESTGGAEPFEFKCKFEEQATLYSKIK
jgi:hypothetical protein